MYGRVFDMLFTGSMRGKGDLQLVWTYFLVHRTKDGICDFTPQCIADATGKPLSLVEDCIKQLEAPDPMSRTRTDAGRRLRRLDEERGWGWQVVNHAHYEAIATRESMRDAERLRKQEYRVGKKGSCPGHVPDKDGHSTSTSGDTGTDSSTTKNGKRFKPPTPAEVTAYAKSIDFDLDGENFCNFYESKGWKVGNTPMKKWQAAVCTWKKRDTTPQSGQAVASSRRKQRDAAIIDDYVKEVRRTQQHGNAESMAALKDKIRDTITPSGLARVEQLVRTRRPVA